MNLDTTAKTLQIVFGEVKTTNDCDITTSYADSSLPSSFDLLNSNAKTNGTTPVTAVAAPLSGVQRQVKEVRVFNNDTVPHTVTLQLFDGTNTWIVQQELITVGAGFLYTPEGGASSGGGGTSEWNAGTVNALSTAFAISTGTLEISTSASIEIADLQATAGILAANIQATSGLETAALEVTGTLTSFPIGAGLSLSSGTLVATGSALGSIVTAGGLTANGTLGGTLTSTGTIGLETLAPTSLFGNAAVTAGTMAAIAVGGALSLAAAGTLNLGTIVGTSLLGNATGLGAVPAGVPIGNGLSINTGSLVIALVQGTNVTITGGNTISATSGGSGSVTTVVAQGGPFLANGTITVAGTIDNSSSSLTAHGILLGEGTGAAVATAAMTNGQLLIGATSADPAPQTMSGDATINSGGTVTVSKAGGVTIPTVAGLGISLNGSTIASHQQITLNATTTGTFTILPTLGVSSVLVNGPSAGGAITLDIGAANAVDQSIKINISQGATAATWSLGTGFSFGAILSSYTATATALQRDVIMAICNIGTIFDIMAITQGFTA